MIENFSGQEPVSTAGASPGISGRTDGSLISRTRNPYWMAPMSGITDVCFRQLMDELGAGILVSDLVSAKGLIYGSGKTLGMIRVHANPGTPVGIQLFGESAEDIVAAGRMIKDTGADFIDINLGCPVSKVVKKGCGAALMRDPAKLETYLARIKNGIDLPLTVKMRTGWNEKELTIHECVRAAYNAGCEWVAIHGRTRAQGYSGQADWDLIAKVKERAKIPIVGNGDIRSAERARARLRETGVDAVMIGRGALRNPWIFQQCVGAHMPPGMPPAAMPPRACAEAKGRPGDREASSPHCPRGEWAARWPGPMDILFRYRDLLQEHYDPRRTLLMARKLAVWMAFGYPGAAAFRGQAFQLHAIASLLDCAARFFDHAAQFPPPRFDESESFMMGGHG
ncbi:MAG: tRNA-dihydrouridine synthase family protein [Nitrospinae bacterium]|nr:tRNA-dihydrouridine synthase family protein [Nitrospinota bacterium]